MPPIKTISSSDETPIRYSHNSTSRQSDKLSQIDLFSKLCGPLTI